MPDKKPPIHLPKPKVQLIQQTGEVAKVDDEKTYRTKLRLMANTLGCLKEVDQLLAKYDQLLKNCTNEQERKAIASMGIIEIHNLINMSDGKGVGMGGTLVIDGQVVIEGKTN